MAERYQDSQMGFIGIVGSRRRNTDSDYKAVEKALLSVYKTGDVLVSGGCAQGADCFAEDIAKWMGLTIVIHYPNWKKHGRAAGFVRNGAIAQDADVLIACVAKDRTGGTEDTIKKFQKLGKTDLIIV